MRIIGRNSGEIRIELDETTLFKGIIVSIKGERLPNGFCAYADSMKVFDDSMVLSADEKKQIASYINDWASQQESIYLEKSNETISGYEIIVR